MGFHVYPVIPTSPACHDYSVTVNGLRAETNTARVSAVPFNRRWPGHQRQIDQSEAVQFLSMATDEPLDFEIRPREPFDASKLKIRPRSLGITPEITQDGAIRFTLPRPAYFTVEAYGRNRALHLFVDPMETVEIDRNDPNLIYFGAGEHDVGVMELHSNQTLYLDEGAVVYACIKAIDAEHIRILGRGILDNSRNVERILYEANAENNISAVNNAVREHTVQLEYCTDVQIEGITIRDSLVYNIRPVGCRALSIKNVKIIGCWRYNSDGIDMHNCVDVHISDCFLRTFDDSICVKGFDCFYEDDVEKAVREAMYRNGKRYDVCKNVRVENCVIWNDWNKCLEIGAETRAEEISHVLFLNCDLIHLTYAALDCTNVDYADVHDIAFKNIRIEADEKIPTPRDQHNDLDVYIPSEQGYAPLTICAGVEYHHECSAGGTRRGRNRDFEFRNIRVWGDCSPRLQFFGYDNEHKTENILIEGLYWNDQPVTSLEGKNWDVREFTDNIRLKADPFSELNKNTVSAENQLHPTDLVTFENADAGGRRVMFVGNSMTRHGFCAPIGWFRDFGMAASAKDKDYVHQMEAAILKDYPDTVFCTCQIASWEVNYKNGETTFELFEQARRFQADVIIVRFIENCAIETFDSEAFARELEKLMDFLNPTKRAHIVVSTGFWRHPGDEQLRDYAKAHALPLVELGDLGDDPVMKAIGLFEHRGVANHPGDEGMRAMAERLMPPVMQALSEIKSVEK